MAATATTQQLQPSDRLLLLRLYLLLDTAGICTPVRSTALVSPPTAGTIDGPVASVSPITAMLMMRRAGIANTGGAGPAMCTRSYSSSVEGYVDVDATDRIFP